MASGTRLIILFFAYCVSVPGQSDTVFFNRDWKACKKTKASYYRLSKNTGAKVLVTDRYISDTLQMVAECFSAEPLVKNGYCVYYYPSGKKNQAGYYENDFKVGKWTTWYEIGNDSSFTDFSNSDIDSAEYSGWVPQNQSSLFIGDVNYRCKINRGPFSSGRGTGVELGLNLGYFFSQKLLAAIFVGLETKDILWNTSYSKEYLADFNSAFNASSLRGNDSLVAQQFALLQSGNRNFHNRAYYWGVMIRLPYRFFPIIKLYTGSSATSAKIGGSGRIGLSPHVSLDKEYDHDYYDITRNLTWGAEIFLFNGWTRVGKYEELHRKKKDLYWCSHTLALSLYMEHVNGTSTQLSYSNGYHDVNISISSLLSTSFLQKYRVENFIGFRLSYGLF